jgi:hypothetical protein
MTTETKTIELQSFHYSFQITRNIVFEVNYYRLGDNQQKHFSTSAACFNRPKTDFDHCGQAQKELLKEGRTAMRFYNAFDKYHLNDLTSEQHAEILKRIEELKAKYNWIKTDHAASFEQLKDLSKIPIRTIKAGK